LRSNQLVNNTADTKSERVLRTLLKSTMREFFQTETSAVLHCRREAERLGEAPPARAMLKIAEQAEQFLKELPSLAEAHDLPKSAGGAAVGAFLSQLRDTVIDRLTRTERSYRVTLLGVRHGVDLVQLLEPAAREASMPELSAFCRRWLEARRPLVAGLEGELAWFANHPTRAMRLAR
jgi:hypothetical protein